MLLVVRDYCIHVFDSGATQLHGVFEIGIVGLDAFVDVRTVIVEDHEVADVLGKQFIEFFPGDNLSGYIGNIYHAEG